MKERKNFYLYILSLALPNIIQQLITNISQLVDNLMVGRLNEIAIAAVSITNQVFFVFTIVLLGLGAAGGIFITQYKGARKEEKITEVYRIILLFNIVIGMIFFVVLTLFPVEVYSLFVKDMSTINSALEYIAFIKYTFLIYPISIAIGTSFRYYGLVKISMYVVMISVLVNVILNYLLIYGNFGFPALGVYGAGMATFISRVVEMSIFIFLTYRLTTPVFTKVRQIFNFEKQILKNFLNKASGLVTNEFLWALGLQVTTVIYTQRITENVAAISISSVLTNLIFVGMGGMSIAISIVVGSSLGQNKFDIARKDSKKIILMSSLIGLFLGVSVFIFSFIITQFYQVSPETIKTARTMIFISASFSWLYYLDASIFFTLRAGGDTRSVLIMDSGFSWVVVVPVAFIIGLFPIYMPFHFFLVQLLDIIKLMIARHRYRKNTWLNNLTIHNNV